MEMIGKIPFGERKILAQFAMLAGLGRKDGKKWTVGSSPIVLHVLQQEKESAMTTNRLVISAKLWERRMWTNDCHSSMSE